MADVNIDVLVGEVSARAATAEENGIIGMRRLRGSHRVEQVG